MDFDALFNIVYEAGDAIPAARLSQPRTPYDRIYTFMSAGII